MTTGVLCTVYVNGVRAADGCSGEDPSSPALLDDLTIVWGRSDTMSQPDPDTCSFEVVDPVGGTAFLDVYRTGHRVDVVATGDTFPDPTQPTFLNPGFETAEVTWSSSGATATRSTTRKHSGAYSLAVKPTGTSGSVLLAPAPFSAPGEDPDAWDNVPTTSIGQTWSGSIAVLAPPHAVVSISPVRFSGPYVTAATVLPVADVVEGTGAWQVVTFEATVQTSGAWLGVEVAVAPPGPAWDEIPPGQTWDATEPTLRWDEFGTTYLDDVAILAPGAGTGRSVLVFSGRVTDMAAAWDDSTGSPVVKVTAAGFTADLQNRTIGSEPWDVESVDERAHRILDLAALPIGIDIADTLDVILLSYRDVDAQGATGLLHEIATSVDGVLWPAVHQTVGAYLVLEDPSQRESLLRLVDVPGPPPELVHTNLATNPDAEAVGGVVVVRTNLVVNPGIRVNATGWNAFAGGSPGGVSQAIAPDGLLAGTQAYRLTWTAGPPANGGGLYYRPAAGTPAAPNATYTWSVYVRPNRAVSMFARIEWNATVSGSAIATAQGANTACPAGVWTRLSVSGSTTNATAAFATFTAYGVAAQQVGDVVDFSCGLVEVGAAVLPYFDGALPAGGDFTYAWTGTANASTSAQRAPSVPGLVLPGTGFAVVSSTQWAAGGTRSARMFPKGTSSDGFAVLGGTAAGGGGNNGAATLVVGKTYTVLATLHQDGPLTGAGNANGSRQIVWIGSGGITKKSSPQQANAAGTYDHRLTFTVEANVYAQIRLYHGHPPGSGEVWWDRLLVVEGDYAGPYFDGRTPDTETMDYAWTGAADASTSTQTTRQRSTIEIERTDPETGFDLSACQILRDPVTWVQTVADVVTRVAVGWLVQGVDEEGLPTTEDSTVEVVDAGLEASYGTRRVQVGTQLQAEEDATDVASRILARTSPTDWRAEGLTLDDEEIPAGEEGVALLLDLLDGTSRIGAPLVLGDLPVWSPAGATTGVYLEGGTYRFVGGRWVLDFTVSAASGLGESAEWDELDPSWTWNAWEPTITWNALRGVGGPI